MFHFNNFIFDELILSSGGIRGCYHVGVIEEINKIYPIHKFKYYTGSSIGCLINTLIVIGYTIEDIKEISINLVWDTFVELKMMNLIEKKGFDEGTKFSLLLKAFFLQKNLQSNITFKELYEKTKKVLTFAVMNITKQQIEYHNVFETPNLSVILSLRMTMNIPFLFTPIKYNQNLYIDGATLEPYPYYVIKIDKKRKLGVFLIEDNMFEKDNNENMNKKEIDLIEYIFTIVQTIWKKQVVRTLNYKIPLNTIQVLDIKTKGFEVNLNKEVKNKMYEYGKDIAKKYFQKKILKKKKKLLLFKYFNLFKNLRSYHQAN